MGPRAPPVAASGRPVAPFAGDNNVARDAARLVLLEEVRGPHVEMAVERAAPNQPAAEGVIRVPLAMGLDVLERGGEVVPVRLPARR